jgi:hypothetical protein
VSKLKKVPKFKSEKEELEFWSTHDSADYINYSKTKRALFPKISQFAFLMIAPWGDPRSMFNDLEFIIFQVTSPIENLFSLNPAWHMQPP